jgi:diguanylate cyclase (GGDEF)-like protein
VQLVRLKFDPPSHLRGELQAQQFQTLRRQIPILYAVLAINTAILAYSIYGSVAVELSVYIPGAFAILIVVRAAVWVTRRSAAPEARHAARYLLSTTLIAAFVSLGLGLWGVVLLHSGVGDKPFVPLFIAFGAIACAYCLSCLPRAAFLTICLATTPVILAMLTSGARLQVAAGLNLLLIFILILRLIAHQYQYVLDGVRAHSRLKELAYTDPLTNLPNRRAFIEYIDAELGAPGNRAAKITVAMIDLDGFKAINDTYGHVAGDEVLIEAASRIQTVCADSRMVARLGGDEFAAVIDKANDSAQIMAVGHKLVHELSKPYSVAGSQLSLAASIGFAFNEKGDDIATALMSRADVALYEVKHAGGSGIQLFKPSMGARLQRRMVIEQALRKTDPAPQIEVVYQPIYDARSRDIVCFEALARWDHPQLGAVSPFEFIGIAEQIGTIAALSEQIFTAAIQEAAGWAAPIGLSINLSAVDLCRPSTPHTIMSLCERFGLDPRRLEVEVTETSVLSDFDAARNQLELLRASGIRVALDDFGSGFASISYLKEVTFDRVKIDGDLISDIMSSSKKRRLVQGILQLCSAIDMPTTVEKIETEAQLAVLVGLGCDRVQGYLLSRPVSAQSARELAVERSNVARPLSTSRHVRHPARG